MNRKILLITLIVGALAALTGCSTYNAPPVAAGPLSVQLIQPPPQSLLAGSSVGLAATVLSDKNNAGVTWSCAPAGSCGSFNPTTTPFQITTLYTAPTSGPAGAVAVPVTITATSIADHTQSASATVPVFVATPALLSGQYAFVLEGFASFGIVGSVVLDGNGNVTSGEADASANGFSLSVTSITGTYTLDPTGHGNLSLSFSGNGFPTFQETHGITVTSSSHAIMAEDDQFNGLTIGGIGSLDLQSAGPSFSATQVAGGYSFTVTGFSAALGLNGTRAGIFTADGAGTISEGILDSNFAGASGGFVSSPFTGTFTPPDTFGRGTMTFSTGDGYVYYIVTPEVLRITTSTNVNNYGNTGSAWGQGQVGTSTAALTGSYVFDNLGFNAQTPNAGGSASGAAGQFTADGGGNISAGIMDVNSGAGGVLADTATTGISLAGSTYSISGSPRGTLTGPSGQTYNIYLTDPNLNLLDPNNNSGGGGALLLETDANFSGIGMAIPQADPASASLSGGTYAILLSDQNNPPNVDGGYSGSLAASAGTFSGEGDFQGQGANNATPIVGSLSGTYTADAANPGHFIVTLNTTPGFPADTPVGNNGPTAGTEAVSVYLASSSQGFVVETDTVAPITGAVELQDTAGLASGQADRQPAHHQQQTYPSSPKASGGHGQLPGHGPGPHAVSIENLRRSQ